MQTFQIVFLFIALSQSEEYLVINGYANGEMVSTFNRYTFDHCYNLDFQLLGYNSYKYQKKGSRYKSISYKESYCQGETVESVEPTSDDTKAPNAIYIADPSYELYMVVHDTTKCAYNSTNSKYFFTSNCYRDTLDGTTMYIKYLTEDKQFVRKTYSDSNCTIEIAKTVYGNCNTCAYFYSTYGTIQCERHEGTNSGSSTLFLILLLFLGLLI